VSLVFGRKAEMSSASYNKGKSAAATVTSDSASSGSFVAGAAGIGNTSWDNIFADDDDENQDNEEEVNLITQTRQTSNLQ